MEDWENWTSCEMHGHDYDETGRCRDCGEHTDQDDKPKDLGT